MAFCFTPLVDKNHDKKRGHSKIDALGVKREQGARQAAERGTGDPVDLVQQGNEEVKEPTEAEKQTVKLLLEHLIDNAKFWKEAE